MQLCFDAKPQVASVEVGIVAVWLLVGVEWVEADTFVLVDAELASSPTIEEVAASVIVLVVDTDCEKVKLVSTAARIEPLEDGVNVSVTRETDAVLSGA